MVIKNKKTGGTYPIDRQTWEYLVTSGSSTKYVVIEEDSETPAGAAAADFKTLVRDAKGATDKNEALKLYLKALEIKNTTPIKAKVATLRAQLADTEEVKG